MHKARYWAGFVTIVLTLLSSGHAVGKELQNNALRVGGSDNVARFVSVYAKEYMSNHPGTDIVVIGGKTSTGVRDLLEGRGNLAMASRRMTPEEKGNALKKEINVVERQIGWCSIVIVTHPANAISELDKGQISKIFRGEYTNWKQLGGSDLPITVIVVEDIDYDPVVFFRKFVLAGAQYTKNALVVSGTRTILPKVLETEGAIAFCRVTDLEYRERRHKTSAHGANHGSGHSGRSTYLPKVLAVREAPGAAAIKPPSHHDHMAAASHSRPEIRYPLRYPLYVYFAADSSVGLTEDFVDYCVSRGMGTAHHPKGGEH